MKFIQDIKGVDIYLLDQILKGNISSDQRILDAGCGYGRNLRPFLENDYNIIGIDPKPDVIASLKANYPNNKEQFICSSIEEYSDNAGFDFIICNAVLHFANNHVHFEQIFDSLIKLLKQAGILFIRMTSNIGLDVKDDVNGVFQLLDGSQRYLLTRKKLELLQEQYQFKLLEPLKTVNVNDLRCMSTLVLKK